MKLAILSDLHLQYENPIARLDNYFETAINKLKWVRETIGEETPLLIAGDIFDRGKPRDFLKMHGAVSIVLLRSKAIYGNHDISFHQASYLPETAYASVGRVVNYHLALPTLIAPNIRVYPFNFGDEINHSKTLGGELSIAMTHQFVYNEKQPFDKGVSALYLLMEYPEYDLIITGDNHQHFIVEYDGRYLINNGSLMRMTSAQKDYQPVVTIWEDGIISTIPIPIDKEAVTDFHIALAQEKLDSKTSMLAYMEMVRNAQNETYDFTTNLLTRIQQLPKTLTKKTLMEVYEELREGE